MGGSRGGLNRGSETPSIFQNMSICNGKICWTPPGLKLDPTWSRARPQWENLLDPRTCDLPIWKFPITNLFSTSAREALYTSGRTARKSSAIFILSRAGLVSRAARWKNWPFTVHSRYLGTKKPLYSHYIYIGFSAKVTVSLCQDIVNEL